jgi:hypothetical protein
MFCSIDAVIVVEDIAATDTDALSNVVAEMETVEDAVTAITASL